LGINGDSGRFVSARIAELGQSANVRLFKPVNTHYKNQQFVDSDYSRIIRELINTQINLQAQNNPTYFY